MHKTDSSVTSKSSKSDKFVSIKEQQMEEEKHQVLKEQLNSSPLLVDESNSDSAYFY